MNHRLAEGLLGFRHKKKRPMAAFSYEDARAGLLVPFS